MMRGLAFVPAMKPGSPGSGGPGGRGVALGEGAGDGEGAEASLGAGVALGEGAGAHASDTTASGVVLRQPDKHVLTILGE